MGKGIPTSGSGRDRFGDEDDDGDSLSEAAAEVAAGGFLELELEPELYCWPTVGTERVTWAADEGGGGGGGGTADLVGCVDRSAGDWTVVLAVVQVDAFADTAVTAAVTAVTVANAVTPLFCCCCCC